MNRFLFMTSGGIGIYLSYLSNHRRMHEFWTLVFLIGMGVTLITLICYYQDKIHKRKTRETPIIKNKTR